MPTATLVTTTVLTCLVVALGCRDRAVEELVAPRKTIQRTTTIRTPPPSPEPAGTVTRASAGTAPAAFAVRRRPLSTLGGVGLLRR